MILSDCYQCDRCADDYYFSDAYDYFHKEETGETIYLIHGWYGFTDGSDICENCFDKYWKTVNSSSLSKEKSHPSRT